MPLDPSVVYRAKWVVPVASPPIEGGFVGINSGVITSVSNTRPIDCEVVDLADRFGDVALIPGLINAHTHLEFSDLDRPLGQTGIGFTDWVRKVVVHRMSGGSTESKAAAIRSGIAESQEAGVVAIGEIATIALGQESAPAFDLEPYNMERDHGPIELTLFLEMLGRDPAAVPARTGLAGEWLERNHGDSICAAISPHAPYSIHDDLLSGVIDLASKHSAPVAMHLAETRDELQLLHELDGPFVQLLKDFGVWFPETHRRGSRILDYLQQLARAPRSLVIHGNYLSEEEQKFIADRQESMSVVYCPRTHVFFGHDRYPLNELTEQGINVAIGTDSRASNPDLNLMAELRFVRDEFPDLSARDVLSLGTIAGAKALGIESRLGSIEVGKRAAMNWCALEERTTHNVEEAILDRNAQRLGNPTR